MRTVWFVEGTACGLAFNSALVVRSVELLFVGNIFIFCCTLVWFELSLVGNIFLSFWER